MLVFQGILSRESASCCFFNSEYIMVELNQVFTKTMAFCHPMHRIMQEYLETLAAHSRSPTTALQCSPGTVNRSVEEFMTFMSVISCDTVDGRNHQLIPFLP